MNTRILCLIHASYLFPKACCARPGLATSGRRATSVAILSLAAAWSSAQTPPTFTSIADQGIAESLVWSNGQGTFLLQKKADFGDPNWLDVLTTHDRSVLLPKDAQHSCFRLQCLVTNTVFAFSVLLNGASEVPPTSSAAQGIGTLSLEGSNLTYTITFSGLSTNATAGHIHAPATTTGNASVIIPFSVPAAKSGTITGTALLTSDEVSNILSGFAYVNIHTSLNPAGEIRGQIVPLRFPISMNGASEAPPVATSATASGTLTMIGSQLYYSITFTNLSSPATLAHIHGPALPGVSAGVLVALPNPPAATSGTMSGSVSLTPANLATLLSGETYMNIHSMVNPGGEIRGQIWPVQLTATLDGASEVPTNSSAGTGSGFMTITNGVMNYSFTFANLSANATAAHIHGPAAPGGTAGVIIPFSGVPSATSGSFSGTVSPNSSTLFWLITGQTYANIHTTSFPGGEIRGQVEPSN